MAVQMIMADILVVLLQRLQEILDIMAPGGLAGWAAVFHDGKPAFPRRIS